MIHTSEYRIKNQSIESDLIQLWIGLS